MTTERKALREIAQDLILDSIAAGLSAAASGDHYMESTLATLTDADREKVLADAKKLADRIAKTMGYDAAWYA